MHFIKERWRERENALLKSATFSQAITRGTEQPCVWACLVFKKTRISESMFSRKQEFYYLNPCFSSQASKAANKSSFSLRSAVAARSLNLRRKAGGTLKASASRLAVFTVATGRGAGGGAGGAGAIRCTASGMGAACSCSLSRFLVFKNFLSHALPQGGDFLRSNTMRVDLKGGFTVRERFRINHALMHAGRQDQA